MTTYHVCLSLDEGDQQDERWGPVTVKEGLTREEAVMLMERVAKDLQSRGLYIDDIRCLNNGFQGFANALQVRKRHGDDLDLIGCIFFAPDT